MSCIIKLHERIGSELLLVPAVAAVIRDPEDRILLQEKSSGEGWSRPAGATEPGETPDEAVVREVAGETGLSVRRTRLLGVVGGREYRYAYPNGDLVEYMVALFRYWISERGGRPTDPETKSLRWRV